MKLHRTIVPPIKCQGIKTKLVPWIKAVVPSDFNGTWIEPFMGSGVVAFNVLPKRAILADSNPHLIHFYQGIASGRITSTLTRSHLEAEGTKLLRSEDNRNPMLEALVMNYEAALDDARSAETIQGRLLERATRYSTRRL